MHSQILEQRTQTAEAMQAIKKITAFEPEIAIILGTGLGALAKEITPVTVIEYENIPHFPVSTVESHHGKLIFGELAGKKVVAMQGRFHYYEGYTMKQITFPVRVFKAMGIKTIFVSNACGALNPIYRKSDLMIIDDHINLIGDNPLVGPNDDELGPRFPDMSEPYSRDMIELAEKVALENKIKVQKGVYVALPGPNLETRAEYRFLRTIGADVVGMSTIPEIIVAKHAGMKTFGISIITDECFPDSLVPAELSHILAAAAVAEPSMSLLIKEMIKAM